MYGTLLGGFQLKHCQIVAKFLLTILQSQGPRTKFCASLRRFKNVKKLKASKKKDCGIWEKHLVFLNDTRRQVSDGLQGACLACVSVSVRTTLRVAGRLLGSEQGR